MKYQHHQKKGPSPVVYVCIGMILVSVLTYLGNLILEWWIL